MPLLFPTMAIAPGNAESVGRGNAGYQWGGQQGARNPALAAARFNGNRARQRLVGDDGGVGLPGQQLCHNPGISSLPSADDVADGRGD